MCVGERMRLECVAKPYTVSSAEEGQREREARELERKVVQSELGEHLEMMKVIIFRRRWRRCYTRARTHTHAHPRQHTHRRPSTLTDSEGVLRRALPHLLNLYVRAAAPVRSPIRSTVSRERPQTHSFYSSMR